MEDAMPDFSGYATKANLVCSDGRTITPEAFQHMDGQKVPLVWQHIHNDLNNVLGHAYLEARPDGMYARAYFNDSEPARQAKTLVEHGDVDSLSIYANRLVEKGKTVLHGVIREVSLVLSGANPGALIDNVRVAHSDDTIELLEDEATITTGLPLEFAHADDDGDDDETIQDVLGTLNEKQKAVFDYLLEEALKHADEDESNEDESNEDESNEDESESNNVTHSDTNNLEGSEMTHNVFEKKDGSNEAVLSHAAMTSILEGAKRIGSMKEAVEDYALKHGIDEIETLFPDAKAISTTPEFLSRRTEWVNEVMTGTRHTPFSRIKSLTANLTLEEARAKGYVKGNKKKEEFFKVSKRVTTPQTIYKKQKLERDDILDITDFDVVAWLKGEMRLMLEEEIARAILLGDGRSAGDDDKIKEEHIRPIATDDDFYVTYVYVNVDGANASDDEIIDSVTMQRRHYRGSGNPTLFTSETMLARLLLIKDSLGRRLYPTVNDLMAVFRVSKIVTVEIMDEPGNDVLGVLVNLQDYNVGADKGGSVALFDDFDIDYNQYKYLIETRVSGALVKPKSALVIKKVAANDVLVRPATPTWDADEHEITIPTVTGVTYKNKLTNTTVTGTVALADGDEVTIIAVPNSGYYLNSSAEDEFVFTYEHGLESGAIV